jgi:hypothetical protein
MSSNPANPIKTTVEPTHGTEVHSTYFADQIKQARLADLKRKIADIADNKLNNNKGGKRKSQTRKKNNKRKTRNNQSKKKNKRRTRRHKIGG